MKRLWRPVCVWILGHDWCYYYDDNNGGLIVTRRPDLPQNDWVRRGARFLGMFCPRCYDSIGNVK